MYLAVTRQKNIVRLPTVSQVFFFFYLVWWNDLFIEMHCFALNLNVFSK